jgi:murein L,D-transpeptidase YafK
VVDPMKKIWVVLIAASAVLLAGCSLPGGPHLNPLSEQAQALLAEKGMRQDKPIFVRVFKEESELEVWKAKDDGRFYHFKTYPVCNWSGKLGPKQKVGDKQAPEGFYRVSARQMNPASSYHLSFNMGYPNAYDRANERTGNHLMIHGDCKSVGCYAMTDALMEEIYILARESFKGGQESFEVHAYPFRMTNKNIKRHKRNKWTPFWREIKKGYDHFQKVKQPPPVKVCERRYLVNVAFVDGENEVDPAGICPTYQRLPTEAVPPQPMMQEANTKRRQMQQAAVGSPAEASAETAANSASMGFGSTFRFTPRKPSVAGYAFRLNSTLSGK